MKKDEVVTKIKKMPWYFILALVLAGIALVVLIFRFIGGLFRGVTSTFTSIIPGMGGSSSKGGPNPTGRAAVQAARADKQTAKAEKVREKVETRAEKADDKNAKRDFRACKRSCPAGAFGKKRAAKRACKRACGDQYRGRVDATTLNERDADD